MTRVWSRKSICTIVLVVLVANLPAQAARRPVQANGPAVASWPQSNSSATMTWWCLDLNDLLHVNVPVAVKADFLVPPDPPPFQTNCTPTAFPVTVPNGSQFVPSGSQIWYTNKTYPPLIRDALVADGYQFGSNSPAGDLMSKLDEIRVDVRTYPANELVATFSFDPRQNFRLLQYQDMYAAFGDPEAVINPELDISLTSDEISRLPLLTFPCKAGPVPPGEYRAVVSWHLTETHNDGMGLDDTNFLYAGRFTYGSARFVVTP